MVKNNVASDMHICIAITPGLIPTPAFGTSHLITAIKLNRNMDRNLKAAVMGVGTGL